MMKAPMPLNWPENSASSTMSTAFRRRNTGTRCPKVQYALDQPLADPSCVALYFVSKLAAEHVKVVLSGEGADELFGGYRIYHEPSSLAGYQKLPRFLRRAAAAVARAIPFDFKGKSFLIRASKTLEERFIGNAYMFTKKREGGSAQGYSRHRPRRPDRGVVCPL